MRGEVSVARLRALLDDRRLSPREAVMLCRDVAEDAFCLSLHERALAKASYAAARIAEDSARATTGVPLAVEDCLSMQGLPFACGPDGEAAYDATLVRKLDRYGALIVGKTRILPYGLGVSCSVGAAEAVARRQCAAALGVGLLPPACRAGLTALLPTFGMVSRYGVCVAAPSLARVGVVAHSARDCAVVMDAITDFDPYDPAMLRPNCYDYAQRIGAVDASMIGHARLPPDVREVYAAAQAIEALFLPPRHRALPSSELDAAIALGRQLAQENRCEAVQRARGALAREALALLGGYDAVELPAREETAMLAALSGLPCVCAQGKMLLGRPEEEATLLALAHLCEGGNAP